MRSPVAAGAVLALAASTAAVASVAHLEARRDRGHAHVPAALRARAQGGPVGWVARVPPPPPASSTTTPGATTPATEPTPTTTTTTPPPTTEPTPLPRRTGVQLDETPAFTLTITRNPVAAGAVELTATNVGEDDHDLSVRDGSTVLAATGTIPPQEAAAITVDLAPGDYTLFCSLPGHEQGGMKGTLRVQ